MPVSHALFAALAAFALACGDASGPTFVRSEAQPGEAISLTFGRECAPCHGGRGEGSGGFPPLPGESDEDGYIEIVRTGQRSMPAFTEQEIGDDELRSDYLWMTTRRR
jgi:mono/diheme cytochrome c family protein